MAMSRVIYALTVTYRDLVTVGYRHQRGVRSRRRTGLRPLRSPTAGTALLRSEAVDTPISIGSGIITVTVRGVFALHQHPGLVRRLYEEFNAAADELDYE